MDHSVTIIGLVILVLFAIPLFFAIKKNYSKKAAINKVINQFNQEKKVSLDQLETVNHKVMAIDSNQKAILFVDLKNNNEATFIDLKQIAKCKLSKTTQFDQYNDEIIIRIELLFENKDRQLRETSLLFYDFEHDNSMQVLLENDHTMAKKWLAIINDSL